MDSITAGWARIGSVLRQRLRHDERGASFVEYAMLLALIAIVCLVAVTMIGNTTGESLSSTASQLP
jgi:pilus assembly protein Flp/PilA